jgi:hypothetical protein
MRLGLKYTLVMLWIIGCQSASAHLDSVRVMVSFPTQIQQSFKLSLVGSSSGLKITGAKLSVLVQNTNIQKEFFFTETQPGIYESSAPFNSGQYNFKFFDKTLPNEALEYDIITVLPRPINQSTLLFTLPATRGSTVTNLWLVVLAAPVGLFLILGVLVQKRRKPKTAFKLELHKLE